MHLYHIITSKCSFTEKLEEIHSVPLVRKLIRISAPLFWLASFPTNFHNIIENPSCNFVSHKYKNGYLLGRHASNGPLHRRDKHVSQHSNLLVTTSWFVINWKKSVLTPVQEIEFLGLKSNPVNLNISLTEEKIQKVKTKCQNLLTEPATSILELTRVISLLTSTIQAVLPARLQCWYLQLQKMSFLNESH